MTDRTENDNNNSSTPEDLIDPWNVLPPIKANFSTISAAVEYYRPRAAKAHKAQALLQRAADLARTVCKHCTEAEATLLQLTAAQRLTLGLDRDDLSPGELSGQLAPLADTFEAAAQVYGARAETLDRTILALQAAD